MSLIGDDSEAGNRSTKSKTTDDVPTGPDVRKKTTLPLGDVNVMVVTDVHSWVAGHAPHEPALNADYGTVLSFYQHVHDLVVGSSDGNLFFVMNGDFTDGTGLGTAPPDHLIPILERMPWSAVTVGNHELYSAATVDAIARPGGFADRWGGRYLTSNVVLSRSGEALGSRYTVLTGGDGRTRVLTFGFLYDMNDADDSVTVERVRDVVRTEWFDDALTREEYDAVLVLAHMDYRDPLVAVILSAVRDVVGVTVPVQFITGHSHVRAYDGATDACSTSFEAGRYLDTVGFVSVSAGCEFAHVFIDANVGALADAVAVDSLDTDEGRALSNLIRETRERTGLLDTVGCAPHDFSHRYDLNSTASFWRLYLEDVVPTSRLFRRGDATRKKALFQDTGAFRYDLYDGTVTVNDVITLSPFDDTFYLVASDIPGSVVAAVHERVSEEKKVLFGVEQSYPSVAMSPPYPPPFANDTYDLYAGNYGIDRLLKVLSDELGYDVRPIALGKDFSTTSLITEYIGENWACQKKGGGRGTHNFHEPKLLPHHLPHTDTDGVFRTLGGSFGTQVLVGLSAPSYFVAAAGFFLYRRRKRVLRQRFTFENIESELV